MTDVAHLIQDLRAEAPTAAPEHAQLMRDAAALLDRFKHLIGVSLADARVDAPPVLPPGADPRETRQARPGRDHRQVKGATTC
jgi:hypothetical protein